MGLEYFGGPRTLNGLVVETQNFAVASSGTDFNINSSGDTHTFNIPSASASNRGLVTTGSQTFAGVKTFSDSPVVTSSTVNLQLNATSTSGLSSTSFYENGSLKAYVGFLNSAAIRPNRLEIYSVSTNPIVFLCGSTTTKLDIDSAGVNFTAPLHINNVYTSSTNFERLKIIANANVYQIGSFLGSAGGSNRQIKFGHFDSSSTFTSYLDINTDSTISIGNGINISFNTSTGTKIGTGATQKIGFWNSTPVIQSTGWSTSNSSSTKVINVNATTLNEVANVLATIIETLKTYGIVGA